MHVAEAESTATVYPAAYNLFSAVTYTHKFENLIAAREELLFKSIRADTKIDQKRKEQRLIRRREDEEEEGRDE